MTSPAAGGTFRAEAGERVLLVTGATGYVGGRLLRRLHERGERVRCLARAPDSLLTRVPAGVEVTRGDLLDAGSLAAPLRGVDTVFYLVHSMGSGRDFEVADRAAAENLGAAAREAGVRRIVYLGGLAPTSDLSKHLESRREVGRILSRSGIQTLELRASIILGSGSLSFEMIRALVEALPVMLTPRWVRQLAQPIAIDDVLEYLAAAVDAPTAASEIVELGGPDRVSYADLMREYAGQRGLRRVFLRVPLLTPHLSSLWLALVTPLYARVGRTLIDSIRNETVVTSSRAAELFPAIRPRGVSAAIARALANEEDEFARTRWSDAFSTSEPGHAWGGEHVGSRRVDSRVVLLDLPPEAAFAPIERIGGDTGWYFANPLWRIRGLLDDLVGGVGLRRGRTHPGRLAVGDTVDFWRVEAVEPGRLVRLRAEMRLPGRAWLQFEATGRDDASQLRQTAVFQPRGLAGLAYWYLLYPVHALIFEHMLRRIGSAAGETGRGGRARGGR